jgi:hypothetical protein
VINQGEIYFATLDGAGRRPVIVASRESFNRTLIKAVGHVLDSDCEPA